MFIFEAVMLKDKCNKRIQEEDHLRNSAVKQGLNYCVRCVPTPEEIPIIANALGLPVKQLVSQYMVADEIDGCYFLRWANTEQNDIPGEFLNDYRTYDSGDCIIMYDPAKKVCRIWSVCPEDGKGFSCWEESSEKHHAIHQWKKGELERFGVERPQKWVVSSEEEEMEV